MRTAHRTSVGVGVGVGVAVIRPLAAGAAAVRRFYRPFLLIQAAAVAVVVGYRHSAAFRSFCAVLAAIKVEGGLPFAAVSAALSGAILPEIAKVIGDHRRYTLVGRRGEILFNLAFFAFNGVVIDILYRGEALLFGTGTAFATIAEKALFDQFVFTPVWLPFIIGLFLWRHERLSTAATRAALRVPGFYRRRVVPLLLPNWLFWIPMVCVIYALPVPLQYVLFILALGAWSLIMVFIANATTTTAATTSPGAADEPE